jgi:short-subunit dehydrogenase
MAKGVFITGATSGIGEALAEEFASKGTYSLALSGRRIDRLRELKERIEAKHKGVQVEITQLDVSKVPPSRPPFVVLFLPLHRLAPLIFKKK